MRRTRFWRLEGVTFASCMHHARARASDAQKLHLAEARAQLLLKGTRAETPSGGRADPAPTSFWRVRSPSTRAQHARNDLNFAKICTAQRPEAARHSK